MENESEEFSSFAASPVVRMSLTVAASALVAAGVLLAAPAARAETRTYLSLHARLLPAKSKITDSDKKKNGHWVGTHVWANEKSHPARPDLSLFLKEENRFRDQGLVLNKAFAGFQSHATSWLGFNLYYAKKDMFYTKPLSKHLGSADVFAKAKLGPFWGYTRVGNEWHMTDKFYRLRDYFEVGWVTPAPWLTVWAAEEFRYDADVGRLNMNDNRFGLGFKVRKMLKVRPFVDIENKRRGKPTWHELTFVGVSVGVNI